MLSCVEQVALMNKIQVNYRLIIYVRQLLPNSMLDDPGKSIHRMSLK